MGSQTITANSATQFVVAAGTTLTPGGVVTVGGTTYSLASGATAVVVNGVTSTLSQAIAPGQTLTPGGVVTVSGTTISLASGGSTFVINGVTSTRATSQQTPGAAATIPLLTVGSQTFT
ncbi:hypothetical protein BAUCODRAFT_77756, partial [Baudoinia panamericana UAMH 10762]